MPLEYIGPTQPIFNTAGIKRQVDAALGQLAAEVTREFNATTSTWDTDVDFATTRQSPEEIAVGTNNEIYNYVSGGTRPHVIRGNLAFQTGYNTKTTPRQISSSSGGPFGPFAYAKEVQHPGTVAREFPEAIADKIQPTATRLLQIAVIP